ncbi:hypothetical protein BUALT_Bualt09G0089000 [Buddleja alternifolia]|uniref:Growth-regulating factor n=1 Tax=Buddleja alternifolia TaxID=168488 RepID=A0AAV6X137_9LAMI|nr:hypothetical protein BUALT_Bualt09G0089000 [Buddleja alternifolia]
MDFNLKQWRDQESEEEDQEAATPSAKLPRLLQLNSYHPHPPAPAPASAALPLFAPAEAEPTTPFSSHHHHTNNSTPTKFPRMQGSYFNMAQWQELELQALIFRHMIAGAAVPLQLLHLLNKSIFASSSSSPHNNNYPLHHYVYPHYHPPSLVQSGYWGRGAMDPEPGRCRRTDGKKWRCSRDVVAGQKYCERHMHRGRNRSRKPVEIPTPTTTATPYGRGNGGGEAIKNNLSVTTQGLAAGGGGGGGGGTSHFTLSGHEPSMDLLHLNRRPSDSIIETKYPFEAQNDGQPGENRTLRHFFDDWPRSLHGSDNTATNLSISMPGNPSSDFSLKLGTGNVDESTRDQVAGDGRDRPQLNWGATWGTNMVAPMGGPLAEALRSSTSTSSPTSVLYRLSRGSASEASYVSS